MKFGRGSRFVLVNENDFTCMSCHFYHFYCSLSLSLSFSTLPHSKPTLILTDHSKGNIVQPEVLCIKYFKYVKSLPLTLFCPKS